MNWNPIYWLEVVVAWIIVQFHALFSFLGANPDSGWTWVLSIVGLVVVIRILLIPLFVKQIKAQRGMQILQPELKKLQEKHKNDRERLAQETMALYKNTGTNPLASCIPIIAQAPIFFALFRVLNYQVSAGLGLGALTDELAVSAKQATIFGVTISETFMSSDSLNVKIVTAVMIVLMCASTFLTQRQIMVKNLPAGAADSPFMKQQKILLYVFPLIFAFSGIHFPVGVLTYWLTTNLWTMGQQFYVIRRMPAPGSLAAVALEARQAARHLGSGQALAAPVMDATAGDPSAGSAGGTGPGRTSTGRATPQRNQPVRKPKSGRSGQQRRP